MTCLLGNVSMRHLKVRILFARHRKNLYLSHSWAGFALSKSQELFIGNQEDRTTVQIFFMLRKAGYGWGKNYYQAVVTVEPNNPCLLKVSGGLTLRSGVRRVQVLRHCGFTLF